MNLSLALLSLAIGKPAAPDVAPTPVVAQVTSVSDLHDLPHPPTVRRTNLDVRLDEPSNDVFAIGQRVSVDAAVGDYAYLMGEHVHVASLVHGDLFAMGEVVTIDAVVTGDVYAMGADVVLTEKGRIDGDVHAAAETLTIRGPVGGDMEVGASWLRLEAPVAGSAHLDVGEVQVGRHGTIAGHLQYVAEHRVEDLEAAASGTITFSQRSQHPSHHPEHVP